MASGDDVPASAEDQPFRRAEVTAAEAAQARDHRTRCLRITPGQIRHYASVGGDHNPIHTNPIAAKLFGFPTVIAHGMFSAAAVLANIEGQLPDAVKYSVRFAKPVVLPARAGLYVDRISDGWQLTLRNLSKGDPHLTGTVTSL